MGRSSASVHGRATAPRQWIRWSVGHGFIMTLAALLLVGVLYVASMASVLSKSNIHLSTGTPPQETTVHYDSESPKRPPLRVGMQFPVRVAPAYRPGCVYMDKGHLEDRFVQEDACYTQPQVLQIIEELVLHAAGVFEAYNITYFLESGTLLGSYRHQGVIPHDVDGDLSIDTKGYDFLRSHALPFAAQYQMDVWNSPNYENAGRDEKISARLIHKESALYVDVFVFRDRVDLRTGTAMVGPAPSDCYSNCVHCPRSEGGQTQLLVPREWVYPLRKCWFGPKQLQCPAETVKYLMHQFGEHFMTPA